MRKPLVAGLIAVVVILLAAVIVLTVKYRNTTARYTETRQAEESVRNQFNAALESIVSIQDSLNAIAPQEAHLLRLSQSDSGAPVTQTQKDQMLNTISDIRSSINASKQRIKDLEKSLKGSQTRVEGLTRIIDNLKKAVAEREATIANLTSRIGALTEHVAGLQDTVRQNQEQITEQQGVITERTKELGTVFYVIGTKKELKGKGIITETGGVIGVGKSQQVRGSFNESDFTTLDTDQTTELTIQGKEPRVLSAQSKSSYQLVPNGDTATLTITDPKEFRKVRYLVIMVKG